MKRKIALAMASVMAFASVLTVPFTATATNTVSARIERPRQNGTILSANPVVDNTAATVGARNEPLIANTANRRSFQWLGNRQILGGFGADSVIPTAELVIEVNQVAFATPGVNLPRTRSFQIELTGAGWAFIDAPDLGTSGTVGYIPELTNFDALTHAAFGRTEFMTVRASRGLGMGYNLTGTTQGAPYAGPEGLFTTLFYTGELTGLAQTSWTNIAGGTAPTHGGSTPEFWETYVTGTIGAGTAIGQSEYPVNSTPGSAAGRPVRLAYTIEVDHRNPRVATVTYYVGEGIPWAGVVVVPVVGYATAGNVTATVRNFAGQSNVRTPQSNINLATGVAQATGTTEAIAASIRDVASNGVVQLDTLMIMETLPGTLQYGASFVLEAPRGFEFVAINNVGLPVHANWNIHAAAPWVNPAGEFVARNAANVEIARVGLHRFETGVVARIGFASHNRNSADMVAANRANLTLPGGDRWPQSDIAPEVNVGNRIVDRSRLVVVLTGVSTTHAAGGLITVDGLALRMTASAMANPDNYDLTGNQSINVVGSTHAGQMYNADGNPNNVVVTPATTASPATTPSPAYILGLPGAYGGSPARVDADAVVARANPDRRGIASESVEMFRVPGALGQGLNMHRTAGVVTINPGMAAQRGNNARFFVYELTQGSWALQRGFRFDLVDAEGNSLEGQVKFTNIVVSNDRRAGDDFDHLGGLTTMAGTTLWANHEGNSIRTYENTAANRELAGHARNMQFVDNSSAAIFFGDWRTDADTDVNLSQRFDFAVSPGPDFYGPIYVQMTGLSVDGFLVNNTVQLFNVAQRITVEAETSVIGIGAQTVSVHDIVITDLVNNGVGGNGHEFFVSITEFEEVLTTAAQGIRWNQITPANFSATGMNLAITLNNATATLGFRVLQRTANQGTVTLSNLQVVITREVTHGVFGVVVHGANLETNYSNTDRRGTGAAGHFDSFMIRPYHVREFIVVGTPPDIADLLTTTISFSTAAGNRTVYVDGIANVFESHGVAREIVVRDGTSLVPLRAIAYFMGATSYRDLVFTQTVFMNEVRDTTFVTLADTTVAFVINSPFFSVNDGTHRAMVNVAGVPQNSIVENGVTLIPFRGFGQAFSIPVYWDAATATAWYNHPAGLYN